MDRNHGWNLLVDERLMVFVMEPVVAPGFVIGMDGSFLVLVDRSTSAV